jgi:hypothetical protein
MLVAHQTTNAQNLRKMLWSQGHPERRLKKNEKPTEEQEAIAIVDAAVDAAADGSVVELPGQQLPTIQHTLTLYSRHIELCWRLTSAQQADCTSRCNQLLTLTSTT